MPLFGLGELKHGRHIPHNQRNVRICCQKLVGIWSLKRTLFCLLGCNAGVISAKKWHYCAPSYCSRNMTELESVHRSQSF